MSGRHLLQRGENEEREKKGGQSFTFPVFLQANWSLHPPSVGNLGLHLQLGLVSRPGGLGGVGLLEIATLQYQ